MAETFSTSWTAEFPTFISCALGKGVVKFKPKMKVVEQGRFLWILAWGRWHYVSHLVRTDSKSREKYWGQKSCWHDLNWNSFKVCRTHTLFGHLGFGQPLGHSGWPVAMVIHKSANYLKHKVVASHRILWLPPWEISVSLQTSQQA